MVQIFSFWIIFAILLKAPNASPLVTMNNVHVTLINNILDLVVFKVNFSKY